ncbi:hypothetical protein BURKHO8Y_560003 [Burkholderia sp. 8Y]|nr:hypothetical protein BURKHO8Y_560003 [Burkholderia sp. 8Y]
MPPFLHCVPVPRRPHCSQKGPLSAEQITVGETTIVEDGVLFAERKKPFLLVVVASKGVASAVPKASHLKADYYSEGATLLVRLSYGASGGLLQH